MPNIPEKESGKRHLWPPKEWPKASWFMKRYFDMLFVILIILGAAFFRFMFGAEDGVNNDSDMEVTIGITVGMFGILATFAVVFFAFRAEQTAVNVTSEVAKLFVETAFLEEEQEVKRLLRIAENSDSNSNSDEKQKRKSIYDGVDTPWWQFFAWGAIFFLTLGSLFWLIYFWDLRILANGENLNDGLKLQILTLFIGMLAVLIAFTVILFAARVAQLSEVAGRIESQSTIKKLAASNEELYHKLFEGHDKIRAHKKNGRLPSATVSRFGLLRTPHQDFERKEKESFKILSDDQPSDQFSRRIAFLALGTICLIGLDTLRGEEAIIRSIDGIISSSAFLFTLLIFSTSVFFLGRVLKSAIASSKEEATKASCSAFDQRRVDLNNRIKALKEIEENEMSLDEFLGLLYSEFAVEGIIRKEMPIERVVSTLMHLRHLKEIWGNQEQDAQEQDAQEQDAKARSNPYFSEICNIIKDQFENRRDAFRDYFGNLQEKWEKESWNIWNGDKMIPFIEKTASEFEKEYNNNEERYDIKPLFNFVKEMEREKFEKYLSARATVKDMLPNLAYMTKLGVMVKLLESGLLVLKKNMMPVGPEESVVEVGEDGAVVLPLDTDHHSADDVVKDVLENAKHINSILVKYKLFTPSLLDADESEVILNFKGYENIEQWEKHHDEEERLTFHAFHALRSIELLEDLKEVVPELYGSAMLEAGPVADGTEA